MKLKKNDIAVIVAAAVLLLTAACGRMVYNPASPTEKVTVTFPVN